MILDKLPQNILETLKICSQSANNINIYLVGGVVRDLLLNKQTLDIDVCLEYDAIKFAEKLKNSGYVNIIQTQADLKTAKVEFKNGVILDFATTRKEKYPKASYLPEITNFCCPLKEDILRRDFTINSLAISLSQDNFGEIIDYLGGLEDLEKKQLKILHDKSFIDDPSRIIRALKYAVRFDFELEETTKLLLKDYLKNFNNNICYSRIMSEIELVFMQNPQPAIEKFTEWELNKLFNIPKINNIKFDNKENWFLYFASLFYKCNLIQCQTILEKLNLDNSQKKIIYDLIEIKEKEIDKKNNIEIYNKFINKCSDAIAIYYAITQDSTVIEFLNKLKNIKTEISGEDLIKIGLTPSKEFSVILNQLLEKKISGENLTKEDEIDFAKTFLK